MRQLGRVCGGLWGCWDRVKRKATGFGAQVKGLLRSHKKQFITCGRGIMRVQVSLRDTEAAASHPPVQLAGYYQWSLWDLRPVRCVSF